MINNVNNSAKNKRLEDHRLPDQRYSFDTACNDWWMNIRVRIHLDNPPIFQKRSTDGSHIGFDLRPESATC